MDLKRRLMAAKASEEKEKAEDRQDISERPLTSNLFDALFPTKRH